MIRDFIKLHIATSKLWGSHSLKITHNKKETLLHCKALAAVNQSVAVGTCGFFV